MPSDARAACERILADVSDLVSHHPKIKNPGAGKPPGNTRPLLNACTVLTYTAWEVYIEDLLFEAVPHLQKSRLHLTSEMRKRVAERVRNEPWRLAGPGWRREVEKVVRSVSIGDVGTWGMNTASSKNVNDALELVFGERLLDRCSWRGISADDNKDYIDQLVRRRGSIVHRGAMRAGDGRLTLHWVRDWADWLGKLADKVDALAAETLEGVTGAPPW